jgi:hypothetical protein
MNARILIVLLLAVATGCVDNNASVAISAACFPPTPNADGSCSYPASCATVMLGNLWVDTTYAATGGTLVWPFQVDNQRPSNGTSDGATNTATAYITGYKFKYISSTVSIPDATVIWTTQTVKPVGSRVVAIPVIPSAVATLLAGGAGLLAEVRAEIRATGHYGDGQTFETGPFSVVVNVENGTGAGGTCADPTTPTLIGACPQLGQSAVLLCK